MVLRAPFDGVITGLMATPGDKVQANTTIATVSSRSDVVVELNLEPEDASKLAPGAAVRLTVSFQGSTEIAGKLTSIGASIDPMTHLVKAIVDVPAASGARLALGTTLLAHIDSAGTPRHPDSANGAPRRRQGALRLHRLGRRGQKTGHQGFGRDR